MILTMLNSRHFAITLARTVEVLRARPAATSEQKAALRALLALTKLGPATMSVENGSVSVDGNAIPNTLPSIAMLTSQMATHGVTQIEIAHGASAADVLKLLRALAADPGAPRNDRRLEDKLDESDAASVSVLTVQSEQIGPNRRPASVIRAFKRPEEAKASAEQLATNGSVAPSADLVRKLETLRVELEGKREIIEELRRSRNEFERRAEKAEHVIETSRATASAAAAAAAAANKEAEAASKDVEALRTELEGKTDSIEDLRRSETELEQRAMTAEHAFEKSEADALAGSTEASATESEVTKELEALRSELEGKRESIERLRRSRTELERRAVAAERALEGRSRGLFSMLSRSLRSLFSSSSPYSFELTVTLSETPQRLESIAGHPTRFAIVAPWVPKPGARMDLPWRAVDGDDHKEPREGSCRIQLSWYNAELTIFITADGQSFDNPKILTCRGLLDDSRIRGTFTDSLFLSRAGTFVCEIQKLKVGPSVRPDQASE